MLDAITLDPLTCYQQQLYEEHKARRARWHAAAKRLRIPVNDAQKLLWVQRIVAQEMKVGELEINGHCRFKHLIGPRFMAMFLAKELTDLSLSAISLKFGGRDHSSVDYAVKQCRKRIAADPEFAARVEAIKWKLLRQFAEGG